MNARNLILWLFVTVLVEVALEELNEGKKYRSFEEQKCMSRESRLPSPFLYAAFRRTCFHLHPHVWLSPAFLT